MIKYQGVSTLEVLKDAKNYNKWIADSILAHVTAPVIEIGSGTGNLTNYFLNKKPLYITDRDHGLVEDLKRKFSTEKDIEISILDVTQKPTRQFTSFFSTAISINVLEHINDDDISLKNIYKMLKPNGKLLLLVPAKKKAFTKLDKELGHYRRYEKNELNEKLVNAGFKVDKIYFFNIVGLLSWYTRDKVKRNNINLKPYHIKIFDSIIPFLRLVESMIQVPVGISLIVVATKV